ncbi:MAG TPA: hypothetical protein DHV16_04145 [Nitrospiraceae bacterium]|nr:MAG: hypothetical protein A2Z82_10155 [Nitrospirae bacterium GWA2_46_11]OGW23187.1 MAG: hypothetical protein A2X55_09450 [Nitrospirae bacterium GWB2_47_37]HAK87737.1 hypothetical protein [Nitrospiraceae bacterium]HCZ11445.1 hypothetical protein [Nitrospiraceae bacterium]
MREIMLAGSYWLHSIATVVWIGGIAFILLIVIPSAKQVLGVEAGKLMGDISKRFTPIANYSIIVLFITGAVLAALNKQFSGIGNFSNGWSSGLIVKHVLVLGMAAVHFYRGLILAPKIAKTEPAAEKASLQKLSLNLVKVNFCLGLMVLLFSGIISIL